MANFYNSNCSTLSAGCYLYNGPGLTNPVASGYYSDGVNCITVGFNGYIDSVVACGPSCTPFGTFLYTSCEFNFFCDTLDTADIFADGNCGTYANFYNICQCL